MRFPVKLPTFALVVFSERLFAKFIKVSDDHCWPRSRTSVRLTFILPVALQLYMNTCSCSKGGYKDVLCINDWETNKSSKNRLVQQKISYWMLNKSKLTKSQCKTPVSVLRKIIHWFPSNKVTKALCESDPAANVVPPASISRSSTSLALIERISNKECIDVQEDILVLSFTAIDISDDFTIGKRCVP